MDTIEAARWADAVEEAGQVPSSRSVAVPSDVVLAAEREIRDSCGRVVVAMVLALMMGFLAGAGFGVWMLGPGPHP